MTIIQKNVRTGKVTTRDYTQAELDVIAANQPTKAGADAIMVREKKQAALKVAREKLEEEKLEAMLNDPTAPQEIKDYKSVLPLTR